MTTIREQYLKVIRELKERSSRIDRSPQEKAAFAVLKARAAQDYMAESGGVEPQAR